MVDAFDIERADFSGMTGKPELYIGTCCIRRSSRSMNRAPRAAAATAVIMQLRSRAAGCHRVRLDRPFIYLIRDDPTGAILFVGRLVDPSRWPREAIAWRGCPGLHAARSSIPRQIERATGRAAAAGRLTQECHPVLPGWIGDPPMPIACKVAGCGGRAILAAFGRSGFRFDCTSCSGGVVTDQAPARDTA